ncbi:hypothetical protein Q8A73_004889 [Channa argus]|nr:hypothetical protein Q8A73_004889 [Channa argus]
MALGCASRYRELGGKGATNDAEWLPNFQKPHSAGRWLLANYTPFSRRPKPNTIIYFKSQLSSGKSMQQLARSRRTTVAQLVETLLPSCDHLCKFRFPLSK